MTSDLISNENVFEALSNSETFPNFIPGITSCAVNYKVDLNKTLAGWQRDKTLAPSNP